MSSCPGLNHSDRVHMVQKAKCVLWAVGIGRFWKLGDKVKLEVVDR